MRPLPTVGEGMTNTQHARMGEGCSLPPQPFLSLNCRAALSHAGPRWGEGTFMRAAVADRLESGWGLPLVCHDHLGKRVHVVFRPIGQVFLNIRQREGKAFVPVVQDGGSCYCFTEGLD